VLPLAEDAEAVVRLHVALALGAANDPRSISALAALARRDGADRWIRPAVLSSVRERTSAFFDAFVAAPPSAPAVRGAVMRDLGRLFGAAEPVERCLTLVADICDPRDQLSWQPAALVGVAAGLRTRGMASETLSSLMTLVSAGTPQAQVARERLATLMTRAGELTLRETTPAEERLAAIELLGQGEWSASGGTLLQLLDPQRQDPIQLAAARALGQIRDPAAPASLVAPARWQAYTPRVRDAVLTTLFSEDRLLSVLLDAVARHDIAVSALGASRWQRLTAHRNLAIRQRAEALYTATGTGNAKQRYDRMLQDVLARAGDPGRGAATFAMYCKACHTFGGAGGRVGPDLTGIRNQPVDAILLHIVVPDHEIAPGYEAYTVQTRDGRTIVGRLESEAPNSITLRDAAGEAHTVIRTDIKSMTAATSSLMPSGLDQTISSAELADLIAYLKNSR
jgi:putative heme-binding domain-containing protein